MKQKRMIQKKMSMSEEEWDLVNRAMNEAGCSSLREYVIGVAKAKKQTSYAEQRRAGQLRYNYSELFTAYNKLRAGIDVEQNTQRCVEEIGKICQGL